MIHVAAIITAKPGQRASLIAAMHANLEAVRAEAGCIEYTPVIDAPSTMAAFGDDTVLVLEKWESMEHLMAHARAPHMAAFGAATKEMVASRAIHVLQNA